MNNLDDNTKTWGIVELMGHKVVAGQVSKSEMLGKALLRVHLGLPRELMPLNPRITVKLNGRVVDEFRSTRGYLERDYRVMPAPRGLPNVLELSIDRTVVLRDDGRSLGLRVRYLAWGPA